MRPAEAADRRPWTARGLLALIIVVSAVSAMLLGERSVDHYLLPPLDGGAARPMSRTYSERVALTWLAWASAAGGAAALAWSLLGRRVRAAVWVVLGVGGVVVLNSALIVSALPRPTY